MVIIKNNKTYNVEIKGGTAYNRQAKYTAPVVTGYFYVEDASGSDNTLSIRKNRSDAPAVTVYASTDQSTWTLLGTTSTTAFTATVPANRKLYLKATTNAWGGRIPWNIMTCSSNFKIGGNIMSLLNGDDFIGTQFTSNNTFAFSKLFRDSGATLVDASDLVLPTNVVTSCYEQMFYVCTGLTTPPTLPATTLARQCYFGMFEGCTSLTTAPVLPATTLVDYCYSNMFYRCTSLTTPPALPATTLVDNCYSQMFYDCTSLTTAPVLPATTLANRCYFRMFQNCRSLTTAPVLPATTLARDCYAGIFQGCTALTTPPALTATTLADYCYASMFYGCTSLTTAPVLPVTALAYECYCNMFYGCTSLTTAPVLPATTLTTNCYMFMFQGCSNLNSVTTYANDISASNCLNDWLKGVAATGDFYNLGGATYTSGASGIPSGWTEHTSL